MRTTMGEKIKDLRVESHMTTKRLAQQTGISEAVLNGLENDSGRDDGYSRITKNIELKELGLTDKAIAVP